MINNYILIAYYILGSILYISFGWKDINMIRRKKKIIYEYNIKFFIINID